MLPCCDKPHFSFHLPDIRLRRCQPRNRHPERRTTHIIESAAVEKLNLRNGVKISFQFQANYFGVSQVSFEANSRAI